MTPDELAALTHRPGPGPHRTTITVDGGTVETLADLPPLRDRLLFIGLNPSPVSVEAGHYHQGKLGRTFWKRLGAAGILPPGTPVEAADDALVAAGHGITDLLKLPDAARRGDRCRAHGRRRRALAEDRALAPGRGRVHLQARGLDRRGPAPRGAVGRAVGRRAGRPAVLPDAGPVRPGRVGRRGDQLPAEPRGVPSGRPGVTAGAATPSVTSWSVTSGATSSTPGRPSANAARTSRNPIPTT